MCSMRKGFYIERTRGTRAHAHTHVRAIAWQSIEHRDRIYKNMLFTNDEPFRKHRGNCLHDVIHGTDSEQTKTKR